MSNRKKIYVFLLALLPALLSAYMILIATLFTLLAPVIGEFLASLVLAISVACSFIGIYMVVEDL